MDDELLALGVIELIKQGELFKIGKLLHAGNMNLNPIVMTDKHGKNVIYYALQNACGIPQLISYINSVHRNGLVEKFKLSAELLPEMAAVIRHPVFETHPQDIIDEIINRVYDEESVERLVAIIGQDWLDGYYH